MAAHRNHQASSSTSMSTTTTPPPHVVTPSPRRHHLRALSRRALSENDSMVYLDGPQVYTCSECRTHLTSHDDIISKSFHGRHGRAYLLDQCVNVSVGPAEDRMLITGMHTVSDISCKRCRTLVGWTYARAYESSQRYKEGKYIIEKIHLHLEENDVCYADVGRPAGERVDRWRVRSMSWGSERGGRRTSTGSYDEAMMIATTPPSSSSSSSSSSPSSSGATSPSSSGVGGLYSRSGSGSGSGGPTTTSCDRLLRGAPPPRTPVRRGTGATAATMATTSPISPGSTGDIVYEYPTR